MINIVCDHDFNDMMKEIEGYQMDLGMRYVKRTSNGVSMDIQDKFVIEFMRKEKNTLFKVGVFGQASIYTYSKLPNNVIWVYADGKEKEVIEYDYDIIKFEFETFLAEILKKLL